MSDNDKKSGLATRCLHAGYEQAEATTGARAVPIYQTSSYCFKDTEHAARLFALEEFGNIYTRLMNPTTDVLEQRVASLAGGIAAVAFASGMGAITAALQTLLTSGDEIVASTRLYGGTVTLFRHELPRWGIKVHWVDSDDPADFEAAVTDRTKVLYAETIGNPALDVADLDGLSRVAERHRLVFVVDNTMASPALCRPIEHGAHVVVHSLTKYLGGHGTSIGGIVVDSGRYPWGEGRFADLVEPDASYHGVEFYKTFGALAYAVKVRVGPLRNTGACLSPFNAFLILQGIETLPLRMERHSANGQAVAEFLAGHAKVGKVYYPGLPKHATHHLAETYLPDGTSGMVGFEIVGGVEAGKTFIESLEVFSHLANIGDAKSLAIHPASTTHQQLSEAELQAAGVTPSFIRLSVGIEDIDDILGDLRQAFEKCEG
jgi:O-acetylhomoserine (thiol)-lyase